MPRNAAFPAAVFAMRTLKKRRTPAGIFAGILCLFLLCSVSAQAKTPAPAQTYYVADDAGALQPETVQAWEENAAQLEALTGAKMILVTTNEAQPAAAELYEALLKSWQLNLQSSEYTLFFVLNLQTGTYFTCTGTKLIPAADKTALCDTLQTYVEPSFAAKEYDTAVQRFFTAASSRIGLYFSAARENPSKLSKLFSALVPEETSLLVQRGNTTFSLWMSHTGIQIIYVLLAVLVVLGIVFALLPRLRGGRFYKYKGAASPRLRPMLPACFYHKPQISGYEIAAEKQPGAPVKALTFSDFTAACKRGLHKLKTGLNLLGTEMKKQAQERNQK